MSVFKLGDLKCMGLMQWDLKSKEFQCCPPKSLTCISLELEMLLCILMLLEEGINWY